MTAPEHAGGGAEPEVAPHADLDARRTRRTWRIALGGLVAGVLLSALTAVLGGTGRVGLVVFLLLTATGCGLGALYGFLTAVIDDLKGRQPSRRRAIVAGVLFAAAAMLMAMVAGAGG